MDPGFYSAAAVATARPDTEAMQQLLGEFNTLTSVGVGATAPMLFPVQ
jgi:hypothetical protein